MLMHVFDSLQNLLSVTLHFKFRKAFAPLDLLIEGRITAKFHNDVHIVLIFEEVFELYDVRVVHRPMNSNLTL